MRPKIRSAQGNFCLAALRERIIVGAPATFFFYRKQTLVIHFNIINKLKYFHSLILISLMMFVTK